MLSTFLRSSWERGRINKIFYENLAVDLLMYETSFISVGGHLTLTTSGGA